MKSRGHHWTWMILLQGLSGLPLLLYTMTLLSYATGDFPVDLYWWWVISTAIYPVVFLGCSFSAWQSIRRDRPYRALFSSAVPFLYFLILVLIWSWALSGQ